MFLCVSVEMDAECLVLLLSTLIFEAGSLTVKLAILARLVARGPRGLPVSVSQIWSYMPATPCLAFYIGAWGGMNSGPLVFTPSLLRLSHLSSCYCCFYMSTVRMPLLH